MNGRIRSLILLTTTPSFLFYSLLLVAQAQKTQQQQQQRESQLIIGKVNEGGDVLLLRRSDVHPIIDDEGGGDEEEQWVVYDFKPAIPPYSRQKMEDLLFIQRTGNESFDDDEVVADDNNATTITTTEEESCVVIVHESPLLEGDLVDDDNDVEAIAHDRGGVDLKPTSYDVDDDNNNTDSKHAVRDDVEKEDDDDENTVPDGKVYDELDATDDNTIHNTADDDDDDDDDSTDVVKVAEDDDDDEAEEVLNGTQPDDADATLPDDSADGVTLEDDDDDDNKDPEITEDITEDLGNESNTFDVEPAIAEHDTAAPPSGPLPDPDHDDTLDMGENDEAEEEQPSVDTDFSYEEVVDEENEPTEQKQLNAEDATAEGTDGGEFSTDGDESITTNDEGDEGATLFRDEKDGEEERDEDNEVQQEMELEDDTNNVIEEEVEPPIVINDDAPSSSIESSTASFPGVTTVDEQQINIQYDDPLPPTSSLPTSSLPPSSNNKDANREFVTGLDDVDKLFESVEVPDELDVGADGSSMQDVLVGQALKIIMKKVKSLGGAIKVKFDKVATPVKKALPQLGLFGGEDDDDTDVDAIFESLITDNEKMATPNGEDEEDAGNKLNEMLQQLKKKVKDLPLVKSEEAQKVFKFTKEKWEQGKQLFDDLLSIFEGDDEDEDGDFDLSNMNLVDIQSVVR